MFFEFPPHCGQESLWLHCPNNNLNLRVKSEPVTARAELFLYEYTLYTVYCILYSILYLSSTEIRHTALAVLLQIGFLAPVLQQQGPFDCSSSAERALWLLFFSKKNLFDYSSSAERAIWLLFLNRNSPLTTLLQQKGPLAALHQQKGPFGSRSRAARSL